MQFLCEDLAVKLLRRTGTSVVSCLRRLVLLLAWVAGFAVLAMMLATCLDVILRLAGRPLKGAYDLVRMAGVVGVACALPYTTAIKGHVAVEFFFHKLARRGRIAVDSLMRLLCMVLFGALALQSFRFGSSLKAASQVSSTLQWPLFWIAWLLAFCFVVTMLVIVVNLLNPGKEMLKP